MENLKDLDGINIIVKANMPKTRITGEKDDVFRLEVKAPAENNKANIEIIKFFSRLTKKDVKIVKGLTSKKKTLRFK